MSTEHVLERLRDGQLCIAAGDRPEALITLAAAHAADGFPALAGVVLNGGYRPSDQVLDLVAGIGPTLPVILTPHASYETARIVASTRGVLGRGTQRKNDTPLNVFQPHIDGTALLDRKSDVWRKSVSVSVDLGGHRLTTKNIPK